MVSTDKILQRVTDSSFQANGLGPRFVKRSANKNSVQPQGELCRADFHSVTIARIANLPHSSGYLRLWSKGSVDQIRRATADGKLGAPGANITRRDCCAPHQQQPCVWMSE